MAEMSLQNVEGRIQKPGERRISEKVKGSPVHPTHTLNHSSQGDLEDITFTETLTNTLAIEAFAVRFWDKILLSSPGWSPIHSKSWTTAMAQL